MAASKQVLRRQLKAERLALQPDRVTEWSHTICERVRHRVRWRDIKAFHCYTSMQELNEVDTDELIEFALHTYPHIDIYSSQKIRGEWQTVCISRDGIHELYPDLPELDVVIVPMLGFDQSLHRLGYGAGYYDKMLAGQPHAKKIGVCFEQGRLRQLPHEPHDIPVDMIVTERQIYIQ